MKSVTFFAVAALISISDTSFAQYTNFIRQIQFPSEVEYDVQVEAEGEQSSPLAIDPGGARFELWTVKSSPLTNYLLASQYVGAYVPQASAYIITEDPYSEIPRTRADRPFWVLFNVSGLLDGADDPPAAKSVTFRRFVQSYGEDGTSDGLDRSEATLISQGSIDQNGWYVLHYNLSSLPGPDRSKIRGEETFSVYSLEDYQAPEDLLASKFVQIWPVADASINGMVDGQVIKAGSPHVTLTLNDLYPNSQTFAQVYPGPPVLGKQGVIVPGSALVVNDSVPRDAELRLTDWDDVFNQDGQWTFEVLTRTPFGVDRLTYLTLHLDRTIYINGSITSED